MPPAPTPPSRPRLIQLDDAEAVAGAVAALIWEELANSRPLRPLGLATGRTMEPVYAALVQRAQAASGQALQALRQRWLSFNLDEYVGLPGSDPRSFAAFMRTWLGEPLGLEGAQLRLPDGLACDPWGEAVRYGAAVARAGGIGLQILGLGLNGHVGFNEPPCGPEVPCRCVQLSAITRRQNAASFGGDPLAVPQRAITLGMAEILAAQRIVLVVTGAAKAPVLRRLLTDPPTPELPASWLQRHGAVTVLADRAALPERPD
ncbi:glucosamine-6-phosphate deaminase [Cyanobium sp. PCC 7001]|uniref:glucosamine-6-phosphate deaminase n=1 Tax=Cyanobium sp. PCC 7001 TaxID=180281 RepID=UPI00068317CA|nr:glucosamine-6-phosphate deaminase [Cyanobium sp. PCC 7001]